MVINNMLRGATIQTVELLCNDEIVEGWRCFRLLVKTTKGILKFEGRDSTDCEIDIIQDEGEI